MTGLADTLEVGHCPEQFDVATMTLLVMGNEQRRVVVHRLAVLAGEQVTQ